MGAVEQSSGVVESYLSTLEESYGSFSINQRTISISADQYADEHAREATVELQVEVENEDAEVLHVEENGTSTLPSTTVQMDESLEPTIRSTVAEKAGIECRIQDLAAVTILGLHNEDDGECETLYRLGVIFEATKEGGTAGERAIWKEHDAERSPVFI
jgi:ADP-ribose pyrophosphatase YjhB (NUDIX family)